MNKLWLREHGPRALYATRYNAQGALFQLSVSQALLSARLCRRDKTVAQVTTPSHELLIDSIGPPLEELDVTTSGCTHVQNERL